MPDGKEVNVSLGKQDQMVPKAVRRYATTVEMMPDQKTHLGYWKEKQVKSLREEESGGILWLYFRCAGLKRTFQFHKYDGTQTNWFMHEYIPTDRWGIDIFMEVHITTFAMDV
jgi:hypothetical protein